MPRLAIHPGEHLLDQLEALKMSAAEFARRIEVPTNRVTVLINGKRSVTADTALRLARVQHERSLLDELASPTRPSGRAEPRRE